MKSLGEHILVEIRELRKEQRALSSYCQAQFDRLHDQDSRMREDIAGLKARAKVWGGVVGGVCSFAVALLSRLLR